MAAPVYVGATGALEVALVVSAGTELVDLSVREVWVVTLGWLREVVLWTG